MLNNSTKQQPIIVNEKRKGFRVAAIQMASGPSVSANLEEAARLIEDAASKKAELIVLPEYFCCLLYTSPSPRDRTRSRMPSSA